MSTPPALLCRPVDPSEMLTPREQQVLRLIALGSTSKEVAAVLGMAFKTAACHRQRIADKLNAHNTAAMTRAAIELGLLRGGNEPSSTSSSV